MQKPLKELSHIDKIRLRRKPKQGLADKKNILSSDGEVFDSELTFHGTPRKRKYKTNRKKRELKFNNTKGDLNTIERKDAQMKLMTFAPMYTSIYTMTHGRSWTSKYLYIDVLAVIDNRMYRITKLVAKALGYPLLLSSAQWKVPDTVRVNYTTKGLEEDKAFVNDEEKLIEDLSNLMFGFDKGYFWQSLHKLFAYDVPKPIREKKYKQREKVVDTKPELVDKPKKDYRVR